MTRRAVKIGEHWVGDDRRVFIVAEIGINHNGSLELAKKMIDAAVKAGCDAVKFQKRTPALCVPRDQWQIQRDTPWGRLSYIDYRYRIELGEWEYAEIDRYCRRQGILWFASCWDEDAVDFIERFAPCCYKAASASLTDLELLRKLRATGRPLIVSTGMSTLEQVEAAVAAVGRDNLILAHSNSIYPCPLDQINLRVLSTLAQKFPECPIGYSGHEASIAPTVAAVALGAAYVERHLTLDRSMWGTDQSASLEADCFERLVVDTREVSAALGDGVKRVHEGELVYQRKLRRVM